MSADQTYLPPVRRPLKIYAYDPMLGRSPMHRITVDVLNERLSPGPTGSRVQVIDFDGVMKCYYAPVELDHPAVLMQGGLEPSEFDPRFHQQMVYAVAMKVIENFELALGRRFNFRGNKPLKIFPHAFRGANAYFDPRRHALLFGYFSASMETPGANAPGQTVFACLSHDIVAHEMTHAITHRLRRYFFFPTNVDVLAFHEGFADIVSIFQHFGFPAILRDAIQHTRGDLRQNTPLVKLAEQFGHATGKGTALRSAIDEPDPARLRKATESHERGSILVAAVFDAFFKTYQGRIEDLVRIATNGTGRLPEGDLNPDLVGRIAREATSTAQAVLRMCIRAFDYLPPVDITFGDYLRAMVTADFELNPQDESGLRRNMIEAFRVRGIYPAGVHSLSEDSLRWERHAGRDEIAFPPEIMEHVNRKLIMEAAETSRNTALDMAPVGAGGDEEGTRTEEQDGAEEGTSLEDRQLYSMLSKWAAVNRGTLQLKPGAPIEVAGIHSVFRVGQDGQLLVEVVVQFVQKEGNGDMELGGVPFRGGATVVIKADGRVQYVIAKPLDHEALTTEAKERVKARFAAQRTYVAAHDARDAFQIWKDEAYYKGRIKNRLTLAAIHRGGCR